MRRMLKISARLAAQISRGRGRGRGRDGGSEAGGGVGGQSGQSLTPSWCTHRGLRRVVDNFTDCAATAGHSKRADNDDYFPSVANVATLRSDAERSPVLLTTTKFSDAVVETFQRLLFQWHMERFWCGIAVGGSDSDGRNCVVRLPSFLQVVQSSLLAGVELSGCTVLYCLFALCCCVVGSSIGW